MINCKLCRNKCEDNANYCEQCGLKLDSPYEIYESGSAEYEPTEELFELSKIFSSSLDLHMLLRKVDESAASITNAEAGLIMLLDADKKNLRFRGSHDIKTTTVRPFPVNEGIPWWVAQHGLPARIPDVNQDVRYTGVIDRLLDIETENLLCVPVYQENEVIGIIQACNKKDENGFIDQDEQMLSVLANQTAVAIKNAKLATEQRDFFTHVIEILVRAVESTLLVPEGHCWKVAKLSTAIDRELGAKEKQFQDLYYAAALHDLGFLLIRQNGNPNKEKLKQHPILGANMVSDINLLSSTKPIILHHHEFMNGSGYPNGLKGEEIPFNARIIAVVEAYESAVAENNSLDSARSYIEENAGILFDSTVVEVFLDLIDFYED
ncbi:GAF domain-containing protein [Candidatus Poribacteria bacterium]|nr:GAF domain-containing protein [Candidatus Poribacteria bacterium]